MSQRCFKIAKSTSLPFLQTTLLIEPDESGNCDGENVGKIAGTNNEENQEFNTSDVKGESTNHVDIVQSDDDNESNKSSDRDDEDEEIDYES